MTKDLVQFREECLALNYPIMDDETLNVIAASLKTDDVVLELGTCVGYSALYLSQHGQIDITTIERDAHRAAQARLHFEGHPNIHLVYGDALEVTLKAQFDVIIFDAAKAQNTAFFKKYYPLLKPGGTLFVDNVHFHGLLEKPEEVKHRKSLYRMLMKFKSFLEMIEKDDSIESYILDVGDGLLVIKKDSE